METLTRDVPSNMQHHNNSSISNMKHSYVQVHIVTMLNYNNYLTYLCHVYIFFIMLKITFSVIQNMLR